MGAFGGHAELFVYRGGHLMAAPVAEIQSRQAFSRGCQRPANRTEVHPTRDTG